MKFNSRICVKCGGSKTITKEVKIIEQPLFSGMPITTDCPNCNGEGVEYIISPNQLKEYKELKNYHVGVENSMDSGDWSKIL